MVYTEGSVKAIYIENCVLWTTLANVFRMGFNGQALTKDNITMKNCDIIQFQKETGTRRYFVLFHI